MRNDLEMQTRFYDLGERYFWFASQNAIVERVIARQLAPLRAAAGTRVLRILDVGCGPGNTLRRMIPWGSVFGSDFSLDALRFARSKGIRHVLSSDLEHLPIASASTDCVVALDVLEHVERDGRALAEIARVLRPGGVFIFTVPAFMALWRHHDVMYGHFRRYRRREFMDLVRNAGLHVRECRFFKCMFFFPLWVIAKFERVARPLVGARDNFYDVPTWLNRTLTAEIEWEERLGITRLLPFGVALVCVGERPG